MPADDLAARIALARQSLAAGAPLRDPELEQNARIVRAHLDPEYAAELEREHAYTHRRGTGRGRGSAPRSAEEQTRCEWCYRFVVHAGADCRACGHVPDPAIGHRQTARTKAQQERAKRRRRKR